LRRRLKQVGYGEGKRLLSPPRTAPGKHGAKAGGPHALARAGFKGPARALPHAGQMEAAFGRRFHNVKVHTGPAATKANRALGSRAYAVGNQVAFKDANPPASTVAHELAHVAQQSSGPRSPGTAGPRAAVGAEPEARTAASVVSSGGRVRPGMLSKDRPGTLRMECDPEEQSCPEYGEEGGGDTGGGEGHESPPEESWDEGSEGGYGAEESGEEASGEGEYLEGPGGGGGAEGGPGYDESGEGGAGPGEEPAYDESGEGGGAGGAKATPEDPSTWPTVQEWRPDLWSWYTSLAKDFEAMRGEVFTIEGMSKREAGVPTDPKIVEFHHRVDANYAAKIDIEAVFRQQVSPEDESAADDVESRLQTFASEVAFLQVQFRDYQPYLEKLAATCNKDEARIVGNLVKGEANAVQDAEFAFRQANADLARWERALDEAEFMLKFNLCKNAATALLGVTPLGVVSTGVALFDQGMSLIEGSETDVANTVNNASGLVGNFIIVEEKLKTVKEATAGATGAAGGFLGFLYGYSSDKVEVMRVKTHVEESAVRFNAASSRLDGAVSTFNTAMARARELFARSNKSCTGQENSVETF